MYEVVSKQEPGLEKVVVCAVCSTSRRYRTLKVEGWKVDVRLGRCVVVRKRLRKRLRTCRRKSPVSHGVLSLVNLRFDFQSRLLISEGWVQMDDGPGRLAGRRLRLAVIPSSFLCPMLEQMGGQMGGRLPTLNRREGGEARSEAREEGEVRRVRGGVRGGVRGREGAVGNGAASGKRADNLQRASVEDTGPGRTVLSGMNIEHEQSNNRISTDVDRGSLAPAGQSVERHQNESHPYKQDSRLQTPGSRHKTVLDFRLGAGGGYLVLNDGWTWNASLGHARADETSIETKDASMP
ncbi:hypothetical protein BJ875DRAFT_437178 [Amylocarpus encephaloides]|uniref:Uncharacterized protein n=1 Tax=Amylocarpus encephaloides TaxID=45428 RepID=A0A9P8C9D8_9HELO|nr:hypothetical protein BJ875DRAFT_437178 [Amylocarpus encephaloides]